MNRSTLTPGVSSGNSMLTKQVLLVDANAESRNSRAKVMRTLGVTVHCASSARAARSKLESGSYNLVLVDLGADTTAAEALVREIKANAPRQLVRFLVGSPMFVSTSLRDKSTNASMSQTGRPIRKTSATGVKFDFGQKVKDAEIEEVA